MWYDVCVCVCVRVRVCLSLSQWRVMARKTECCRLNGLEISLTVLFLLMTAVSVGLITVLALKLDSEKRNYMF